MMPFQLKLILSFLIGGSYIAFTIWVSERFGSKIGGIMIGLPSTLLVSLVFIAWTQDPAIAVSATLVVPPSIAASSLFLVTFIFLYKYGKMPASVGAAVAWFLLTLPLVLYKPSNLILPVVIASLFFAVAISYLRQFPDRKLKKVHVTFDQFIFRSVLAGSVVALSVYLGKVLGPLWGGLFASFPAAFSSSMYLLERTHGIDFTASVAKTMPYGSIGNVLFAIAFYYLVPTLGLVQGLVFAYLLSLISAIILYRFILHEA